jgi:hypothetical protein
MCNSDAAKRAAANALLQANGRPVKLRTPAPAIATNDAEQLGLAVPEFQDFALSPAVFRTTRASASEGKPARWELLVSADAVETLAGSLNFGAASQMFASAFGVLVDDELLTIVSVSEFEAGGAICAYRLQLREPVNTEV